MTPCGARTVTPRMIRNGQVAIGDKILLEEEMTYEEQTKNADPDSEEKQMAANANSTHQISDSVLVQSSGLNKISKKDEADISDSDDNEEAVVANAQTTNISNQSSSVQRSDSSVSANTRDNTVSAQSSQPQSSTQGNTTISRTPIPTTPLRSSDTLSTAPSVFSLESLPLVYEQMTAYAEHLNDLASETPTFNVPSSPMVPPQYDQSIDYDSIQYLNGFLTTQIGRFIKVEQLVSTNIVTSRTGFLIGVGNNYIILQEITTGNIMAVDYYSIKFVYVYYSQPIFPEINHPSPSE